MPKEALLWLDQRWLKLGRLVIARLCRGSLITSILGLAGLCWADGESAADVELVGTRIVMHRAGNADLVLVDDEIAKENLLISPGGSIAAYNETYRPYSAPYPGPALPIAILDLGLQKESCRGKAEGVGRWLEKLEWLDERWILIRGEYYRFFDSATCSASDLIWGLRYAIAPDRKKVSFIYGPVPIYFEEKPSYELGLAQLVQRDGNETWVWQRLYPKFTTNPIFEQEWKITGVKHFFDSFLGWDAASQRLAFVEETRGEKWLVCLNVMPCSREQPPVLLLRASIDIKRAVKAYVTWDGDMITVKDRPDLEGEDRKPQEWTFRCPPAGSPAATTETGPAEAPRATTQAPEALWRTR